MKQLGSILLSLVLALAPLQTLAAPQGEQTFQLDEAVGEAQTKLDIPSHYTRFSSNVLLNQQEGRLYLTWSGEAAGGQPGGSLTAGLDFKNRIVEVSRYEYGSYTGDYKLSAIDSTQAQALASGYLQQIRPDLAWQVRALPNGAVRLRNNQQYQVIFYRHHADIPYYDNYVSVSVSAHNGQLAQLTVVWDETSDISSETPAVSLLQAQQLFLEQIGLFPSYQRREDGTVFIQYATGLTGDQYINAYTGSVLDAGTHRRAADYAKLGLVAPELTPVQQDGTFPPAERVEQMIRSLPDLKLPRALQVSQCQYYVDGAGITVWIEPSSGELCFYQAKWPTDASLPKPEGMLTTTVAFGLLLEQVPFELQYVSVPQGGSGKAQLRLAYGFRPGFPLFLDAFSGQLTYPDGKGYLNTAALTCDDILGHPQQPYIETLLRSQIIPYSSAFRPEEPITKGEFIQWAQNAIGTAGHDATDLLTDVHDDGFLTNEQATELVVTLLGYGAAAQLPDTYQTGLVDEGAITPGKEGYAAITKGLGIIRGNAFAPNRPVTRGLAAELLYYCIASDE